MSGWYKALGSEDISEVLIDSGSQLLWNGRDGSVSVGYQY
jgi:hypothetical protein